MFSLIIGLLIFTMATSANIFFPRFRGRVVKTSGVFVWKKGIEILTFVGIFFMLGRYGEAKIMSWTLWSANIVTLYLALIINFISIWLVVSAYTSQNIVKIKIANPVILGVTFWALAHIILDGDILSTILFVFLTFWTNMMSKFSTRMAGDIQSPGKRQHHSVKATASTLFLSLMLWIYTIREGFEFFAGVGVTLTK